MEKTKTTTMQDTDIILPAEDAFIIGELAIQNPTYMPFMSPNGCIIYERIDDKELSGKLARIDDDTELIIPIIANRAQCTPPPSIVFNPNCPHRCTLQDIHDVSFEQGVNPLDDAMWLYIVCPEWRA